MTMWVRAGPRCIGLRSEGGCRCGGSALVWEAVCERALRLTLLECLQIVRALVRAGADVHAETKTGGT